MADLNGLDNATKKVARDIARKLGILSAPDEPMTKEARRRVMRKNARQQAKEEQRALDDIWRERPVEIVDSWPDISQSMLLYSTNWLAFDQLVASIPRDFKATQVESVALANERTSKKRPKQFLSQKSKDMRASLRITIFKTRATGHPAGIESAPAPPQPSKQSNVAALTHRLVELAHPRPSFEHTHDDHAPGEACCPAKTLSNPPLSPVQIGSFNNFFSLAKFEIDRSTEKDQASRTRLATLKDHIDPLRKVIAAGMVSEAGMESPEPLLALLSLPPLACLEMLHERFFVRGRLLQAFHGLMVLLNVKPGYNFGNSVYVARGICP